MVVGRTRALQKPVMRVLGGDGATLGYVKIGISDVTRELVRHETAVLHSFETRPPAHFRPPRVLGAEEWMELSVLLQEPVTASLPPEPRAVRRAAVEISLRDGTETVALRESAAWQALKERVRALPTEKTVSQLLKETVEYIDRRWADATVTFGSWHGDFAPWNMGWDGSALGVWDWEGYAGSVPVGFDMIHYRFQGEVVVAGEHPGAAFDALLDEAPTLLSCWEPTEPRLVVALYLVHLVTGLIVTGDSQTRISRVEDWLQPALARVHAAGALA